MTEGTLEPAEQTESEIWHKFIGDASELTKLPKPQAHVLCWAYSNQRPPVPSDGYLYVTMLNSAVTCQDCNELIHS